jgi:hypothetical protein
VVYGLVRECDIYQERTLNLLGLSLKL